MRENAGVLIAVAASVVIGLMLRYIPLFGFLSEGFIIIISAVLGAVIAAILRPIQLETGDRTE